MSIGFIGTGSAINADEIGASILLHETTLVDAPSGVSQALLRARVDLHKLEAVLVTHNHGDHIFGLPFLLLEYMLKPREHPLMVLAPPELEQKVVQLTAVAFPEADPLRLLSFAKPEYTTITHLSEYQVPTGVVKAIRVPHGPIETYGFEFREPSGRVLFYAPDVEYGDAVEAGIEAAHVVILDATTLDVPIPGHMCLQQVIGLANAYPEKLFVVTHRSIYACEDMAMPRNLRIPAAGDILP